MPPLSARSRIDADERATSLEFSAVRRATTLRDSTGLYL